MAVKFLAVSFFFSLVVIYPIHRHYIGTTGMPGMERPSNGTNNDTTPYSFSQYTSGDDGDEGKKRPTPLKPSETDFYWMYVIFVYFFSGLALHLIVQETKKVIRTRQDYLGSQASVTDRTIRLSGIPPELRSEQLIKETIESLNIGQVESVTLCKDWAELDSLLEKRMAILRELEAAWTTYNTSKASGKSLTLDVRSRINGRDEEARLLEGDDVVRADDAEEGGERPTTKIWFGILNLQSRKVDAIHYFEEKLRNMDDEVMSARKQQYRPTPLAFVTLDSTATAVSSQKR